LGDVKDKGRLGNAVATGNFNSFTSLAETIRGSVNLIV